MLTGIYKYERDVVNQVGKYTNVTGNLMTLFEEQKQLNGDFVIETNENGRIFVFYPTTGEVAIMDETYPGIWTKLGTTICTSIVGQSTKVFFQAIDNKIYYTCPGIGNATTSIDIYELNLFDSLNKPNPHTKALSERNILLRQNYSQPVLYSSMNKSFDVGPLTTICPW